jgi:hypothetical protein
MGTAAVTAVVIQFSAVLIALAGILVILGARQIGWRVLAIGVILITTATVLTYRHRIAEHSYATDR